jgi:hypothetical protein
MAGSNIEASGVANTAVGEVMVAIVISGDQLFIENTNFGLP